MDEEPDPLLEDDLLGFDDDEPEPVPELPLCEGLDELVPLPVPLELVGLEDEVNPLLEVLEFDGRPNFLLLMPSLDELLLLLLLGGFEEVSELTWVKVGLN